MGGMAIVGCGGRSFQDDPRPVGGAGAGTSDPTAGSSAFSAVAGNASGGAFNSVAGNPGNATPDDTAPSTAPAVELATGKSLSDVFVGTLGIYVVSSDDVRLFDHRGSLLASRTFSEPPSSVSAAFENERLTIASGSVITTYNARLDVLFSFPRPEYCLLIARFSQERLLCGAWYVGYTVLDGSNGTVLSEADHSFFSGAPLSRVPGRDDFIVNGGPKPLSNVSLLRLNADHHVRFLDETTIPEVGEYNAHGFDGSASPSLISDSGQPIGLRADCAGTTDPANASCFVPGVPSAAVPANSELLGIAPGPAEHQFFGLVDTVRRVDPIPCALGGCELELFDDLSDRVLRQRHVEFVGQPTNLHAFRWDPQAGAVVLGLGHVSAAPEERSYRVVLQPF
jgi:hypothetical protein